MQTPVSSPRFLESELPLLPAGKCRFHVIPVPYEATVSYGGGTAHGPQALLEASSQLEVWTGLAEPSRQGIYTWPAVCCAGTAQEVMGNIETAVTAALEAGPQGPLPQCHAAKGREQVVATGEQVEKELAEMGGECLAAPALPIILGGEHSITLGVLRALQKRYGHFGIVHFDAHADLRQSYQGSIYSHACVMRRAVSDLGLSLFQIGVRSLCPEERDFRTAAGIEYLDARTLQCPRAWHMGQGPVVQLPQGFPRNVFLSFDIDALDASLMPATGTPEPGGLFWWDALNLIRESLAGRVLLGADVVELAPQGEVHAPVFLAARLVHEIMGMVAP